ncbi:MAG: DUF3301 domain-containing protein [Proteobacteria bacterium]|nr:DUF3301 domain-containing protein [Pseudomonadota bacterium]
MTDALLPLSVCVALGLLWYTALRARERAIAYARRLCAGHGAQLLDQSIVLLSLRPLLRDGKLRWLRSYGFDISHAGTDRHAARMTLVGDRVIHYSLPVREDTPADSVVPSPGPRTIAPQRPASADTAAGDNVISIERARRTLH